MTAEQKLSVAKVNTHLPIPTKKATFARKRKQKQNEKELQKEMIKQSAIESFDAI